ncbi:uncharacterized protein B0H18DRAFT_1023016 [Fomitopsis serialis]|uniref:uncharacterized protein n=1 Tax=Fomitopsis serialis TaxID=139415 RepID=UPI0020082868|nr:uncharacterized protein B0H18DRAFT_1023016 [Neoantrodia serialis]KAH9920965.1 hypothetical protein B0H18DRAFT_1023016 [Neoantrodia serialis]
MYHCTASGWALGGLVVSLEIIIHSLTGPSHVPRASAYRTHSYQLVQMNAATSFHSCALALIHRNCCSTFQPSLIMRYNTQQTREVGYIYN